MSVASPKIDEDEAYDKAVPLYCQYSPKHGTWRGIARRYLFPRTHSFMEVHEGRPPLNKQKTIVVDWLDFLVILLVAVTCVLLCLQDPMDRSGALTQSIETGNNVLAFLFAIENVCRVICFGFIYFKADLWNVFDSLIVVLGLITTVIDLIGSNRQSGVEALRILILFRPLRSVRFIDTARITMIASLRAFKSIGDVVLLLLLFLVLVATSGTTQFNSRLRYRCFNQDAWNTTINSSAEFRDLNASYPANYTRFQAYDMRRLDMLRRDVEVKQCGYRYGQYASATNVTTCRYSQVCTSSARVLNRRVPYPQASGNPLVNVSLAGANDVVETAGDELSCVYFDGSVSCTKSTCRAEPVTRMLLVEYPRLRAYWAYLNGTALNRTCNVSGLGPGGATLYCFPVNGRIVAPASAAAGSGGGGGANGAFDGRRAAQFTLQSPAQYCRPLSTSSSDWISGFLTGTGPQPTRSDGTLRSVVPTAFTTWTSSRFDVEATDEAFTEPAPLQLPTDETVCVRSTLQQGIRDLTLREPWRRLDVTWNTTLVNASFLPSGSQPSRSLSCGRWIPDNGTDDSHHLFDWWRATRNGTVAMSFCCVAQNLTQVAQRANVSVEDALHAMMYTHAPVCMFATADAENRTLLNAYDPLRNVTTLLPVGWLARDTSVFGPHGAVCSAAVPNASTSNDIAVLQYVYNQIRPTASADIVFYTKQNTIWNVEAALGKLAVGSAASCARALRAALTYATRNDTTTCETNVTTGNVTCNVTYGTTRIITANASNTLHLQTKRINGSSSSIKLPPVNLTRAVEDIIKASVDMRVVSAVGRAPAGVVQPSPDSYVNVSAAFRSLTAPPIPFNDLAEVFNATTPHVNQTASSDCVLQTECYSVPFARAVEYSCDGQPSWSLEQFLQLPPYDEMFRAQMRTAIGPQDWEVTQWTEQNCDSSRPIVLDGYHCPYGYVCFSYKNPFYSKTGFDNLAKAMLTAFTCITQQSWYIFMYRTMDAVDDTAAVYYLAVTIVGSLFITNLMVVLMTVEFDDCVKEERRKLQIRRLERKEQQKQKRFARSRARALAQGGRPETIGNESMFSGDGVDSQQHAIGPSFSSVAGTLGNQSLFQSSMAPTDVADVMDDEDLDEELEEGTSSDEEGGVSGTDVLKKFGTFLQKQLDQGGLKQRIRERRRRAAAARRGSMDTASLSFRGSDNFSLSGGSGGDIEMLDFERGSSSHRAGDFSDRGSVLDPLDSDGVVVGATSGGSGVIATAGESTFSPFGTKASVPVVGKKLSKLQKIRVQMREALQSQNGLIITNLFILGNMIVLGSAYYGMSETMRETLETLNLAFIVVFSVELAYRLFCIDIWIFVRSTMSIIDLLVVIVSWIDFIVPSFSVPIVRGLRVIRILNLFKPFPNVYKWIKVITRSLQSSVVLFVMCAFCAFIFAVFGMSLFGGRFCDFADGNVGRPDDSIPWCGNRPRSNYDTLVQAVLTSVIIMTGDDWYLTMVNGMRARGDFFAVFFIANYVIGNMILLNLLIGILLSVRTETDEDARRRIELSEKRLAQAKADADWEMVAMLQEREERKRKRFALINFLSAEDEFLAQQEEKKKQKEFSKHELALQSIVESGPYRYTVLIITIINTVGLALESPHRAPDTPAEVVLKFVGIATNIVFVVTLLLECVAYGFVMGPLSYLRRDPWNKFDALMVLVFLVTEIVGAATSSTGRLQFALKAVSSLRSLRPIRFVSRSRGMKLVINSLVDSVGPLGNLLVVIMIVLTLFGIMGVQVFQGLFYTCNGTDPTIDYITLSHDDCEKVGGHWMNAPYHFDNLGAAYMTLFVMSTLEEWSTIMYSGMDATNSFDAAPIVNVQRKNSVYFITFVVIGAMFFVNLFVSIIIDSFQKAQQQEGGGRSNFLTKNQNAWIRSQHTLLNHVAVIDYDGVVTVENVAKERMHIIRKVARYVCRHPLFDVFIYCCIFVNFLVVAVEEYPQSDSMEAFGRATNIFFTSIFVLEVIIRLISESPARYISSKWNRFDVVIVTLSLVAVIFELVFANATFVASFRSMRAARLLRLLRKSRVLQAVLRKFLVAMYSLTNIGGILFLVIFCYGLVGMKLFGRIVFDGNINHNAHFQNIFSAFLLMLRVATGGNWGDILRSCSQDEFAGYCLERLGNCGFNIVAQLFFVSFVVLATFVLLNVFVAVILDVFTSMTGEVEILSAWEASQFMKLWFHFDPERTYRMESRFLLTLLRHIPADCPIGMGTIPKRRRLQHEFVFVESLNLEESDGKIELQDLIQALCERAFRRSKVVSVDGDEEVQTRDEPLPIERSRLLKQKMDRHFRRKKRDRFKPAQTETYPVAYRLAAQILTAYWERRKLIIEHKKRVQQSVAARASFEAQVLEMARRAADGTSADASATPQLTPSTMPGRPFANRSVDAAPVIPLSEVYDAMQKLQEGRSSQVAGSPTERKGQEVYRSLCPQTVGVLSAFRVLDAPQSLSRRAYLAFDQAIPRTSLVDAILSEDAAFQRAKEEASRDFDDDDVPLGVRLIRKAADPTVRPPTEEETLELARLVATRRQLAEQYQRRRQHIDQCRLPDEELDRMRILDEEQESRQYINWVEIQAVSRISVGGVTL